MEVVASFSQGRTASAQCGLFTYKSVPVIFEPPCIFAKVWGHIYLLVGRGGGVRLSLFILQTKKYDYCTNPDDRGRWNVGGIVTARRSSRKSCPVSFFFITYSTWFALGFYPGLSGKLGSLYVIKTLYIYIYIYILPFSKYIFGL